MKTHDLKIERAYLEAIQSGGKKCEIRTNDRDFQRGDHINFFVLLDKDGTVDTSVAHGPYLITHVLSWKGLREGYVCLSIEPTEIQYPLPGSIPSEDKITLEDVPF